MKYSEDTDDRRKANIDYVNQRWKQLNDLDLQFSAEGIKYLMLINSGAAVAVLAFLGSVPSTRDMMWVKLMLGIFVIGVIMIGILHVVRYRGVSALFSNWRKLVNDYFTDQVGWNEIIEDDTKKASNLRWMVYLAYASFACFVIGACIGIFNFSSLNSGESNVRKEAVIAPAKTSSTGKASDPTAGKTH